MTSRSVSLVLPTAWTLTANGRYHHHVRAARTRNIRDAFKHAGHDLDAISPPVEATYQLEFRRGHRRDAANWYPTAKAAVDGLVDAGVLADDSDRHITRTVIPAHTVDNQLPDQHVRLTVTLKEVRP